MTARRMLVVILAATAAAVGCAKTVGPVEFLSTYRRSASSADPKAGYRATYEGRQGGHHYVNVRHSTLAEGGMAMLMWGPFRDEKIRCPESEIPDDFPNGFQQVYTDYDLEEPTGSPGESGQATLKYVLNYLAAHGKPYRPKAQ